MEDTINSKHQMPIEEMPVSKSTQDHFGPHVFNFCSSPEPIFLDPTSVVVTDAVNVDADNESDSDTEELAPSISHRTNIPAEIIPNDIIEFSVPVPNFDFPGPYTYPKDIFDDLAASYVPAAPITPPPPKWSYSNPVPPISSAAAPIHSAYNWNSYYSIPPAQTQSYPGVDGMYSLAPPAPSTPSWNGYASATKPYSYLSSYTPSSPYATSPYSASSLYATSSPHANAPISPYPAITPAPYNRKDPYISWDDLDTYNYTRRIDDENVYEPSEYSTPDVYPYTYPASPLPDLPPLSDLPPKVEKGVENMDIDPLKRGELAKETKRRWLKDLLRAVSGYGLFSLGITMFLLGLVYLYDADKQYRKIAEQTEALSADLGCNSTSFPSQACENLVAAADVDPYHVYMNAGLPYICLFSLVVAYTVIVLSITTWRTARKIVRCVDKGNKFIDLYISQRSVRKEAKAMKAQIRAKTLHLLSPDEDSTCPKSLHCRCSTCTLGSTSLRSSLGLYETLKPKTSEEWICKALQMVFALHIPLILLISVYYPLFSQGGPVPGSYLDYTANAFIALTCFLSVTKFTRQLVAPRHESDSDWSRDGMNEFIEGTGSMLNETRVAVPWVCAKMWKGVLGSEWEDMAEAWENDVREERMMRKVEKMVKNSGVGKNDKAGFNGAGNEKGAWEMV